MNRHEKIHKLLVDFALGNLSPDAKADVDAHVTRCPECENESKRLKAFLDGTDQIRQLSADAQACGAAREAVLRAVRECQVKQLPAGPSMGASLTWRTNMSSRKMKLAAAAAAVMIVLEGVTFWPGGTQGTGQWWLGSPAVWGQEVLAALDTVKGVTCREELILVNSDGSELTLDTWHILYVSHDSYRRDIYDEGVLREIQWYVPDGDGTLQHSVRFDLESYFTHTGEGSFGNTDPVDNMRSFVRQFDMADKLLGEKVVEGRNCAGFEISASKYGDNPGQWTDCIWLDVETKLPVRMEQRGRPLTGQADKTFTKIQHQFDYDPGLSADTFVPRIPEGFIFGHPDEIRAAREKERKE